MIIFSWNLLLIRVTRQASSRNFVWTSDRNPNYRKCRDCIINGKCKKWMVILQLITPSNIYIKLSLVFLQVSNFPSQFRGSICLFTPSNIYKIVTCISPSFKFSFTSFESEKQNEMNGTFAINNANISTKNENRNKPNISIWLLFLSPSNMKVLFNFNLITFTGYYICLFQFDCMLYTPTALQLNLLKRVGLVKYCSFVYYPLQLKLPQPSRPTLPPPCIVIYDLPTIVSSNWRLYL